MFHKVGAVEEIDARQRCVDHAISQMPQRMDDREKEITIELHTFINLAMKVERERIAHERAKKNPTPVGHTEEFVLSPSSVFHGTTLLCNLVKTKNIAHTHLITLFIELQKATELLHQESACYRHISKDYREGSSKLWQKYRNMIEKGHDVSVERIETVRRDSGEFDFSYDVLFRTQYGLLSSLSIPKPEFPGRNLDNSPQKREDHYLYSVYETLLLKDDRLHIVEKMINVHTGLIVNPEGFLVEIMPTDPDGHFVETPLNEVEDFSIFVRAFNKPNVLEGSNLVFFTNTTRSRLANENITFSCFDKKQRTMIIGRVISFPSFFNILSDFIMDAIRTDQHDFFLPLSVDEKDLYLFILDTVKEAVTLKSKNPSTLTENQRVVIDFAQSIAEQEHCTLDALEKNLEQAYLDLVKQEQQTIAQRVIDDAKKTETKQHNKNFKPAVAKKKSKKDADDDLLLEQMMQSAADESQRIEAQNILKERLKSYLGEGKRVQYRHLLKMINFARRSGALEGGEQTFQKGSHRRLGDVSVVVPHAHQSEGSLMARSGRMIQTLLNQFTQRLTTER
ncbi:MAG: hypothetical protein CNLJKLNK_00703 [Holosporales bacterium]